MVMMTTTTPQTTMISLMMMMMIIKKVIMMNLTCTTSSAFGSFLLFRLFHRCKFIVGASRDPVTPGATRRHCIGLAVSIGYTLGGRDRHSALLFAVLHAALLVSREG